MRKTFFNRLLKQKPNFTKDLYRVTFMDSLREDKNFKDLKWFTITISKDKNIDIYLLNVTVQTKAFHLEHELSDNAIKLTHQSLQDRIQKTIDGFFNWDED